MNNLCKKNKFSINNDYFLNYQTPTNISNIVDKETELLTPFMKDNEKTQVKLNNILNPNDFTLNYHNAKKNNNNYDYYYSTRDIGPGRGFGNLNISNDIRKGSQGRLDTKIFKETQESQQLFDYQYQILDKNYQEPFSISLEKLYLPIQLTDNCINLIREISKEIPKGIPKEIPNEIPRGGESTRKHKSNITSTNYLQSYNKSIEFQY